MSHHDKPLNAIHRRRRRRKRTIPLSDKVGTRCAVAAHDLLHELTRAVCVEFNNGVYVDDELTEEAAGHWHRKVGAPRPVTLEGWYGFATQLGKAELWPDHDKARIEQWACDAMERHGLLEEYLNEQEEQ